VTGQGDGAAILAPGMYAKVNHNILLTAAAPEGKYLIHADTTALKQDIALGFMVMPGFGMNFVHVQPAPATPGVHYSGENIELKIYVTDHDRVVPNTTVTGRAAHATKDRMGPASRRARLFRRHVCRGHDRSALHETGGDFGSAG
jgi:hypothetical protein